MLATAILAGVGVIVGVAVASVGVMFGEVVAEGGIEAEGVDVGVGELTAHKLQPLRMIQKRAAIGKQNFFMMTSLNFAAKLRGINFDFNE